MFLGTIDDNVRRYIASNRGAFNNRVVAVGCSGNFTSEKVLAQESKPLAIHSNDVSLYSLLLADAMMGVDRPLTIQVEGWEWLGEHIESGKRWERVATIMLLLRMLKHEKQASVHARRMWKHYAANFGDLVTASAEKLAGKGVPIASYYNGDVWDFFKTIGQDAIFSAYLPFYKGDYERQYKRAQEIIGWPNPTYELLGDDRKQQIIRWLMEPGREYLFLLDHPLDGVAPQLISHKKRNTWIYLYSNVVEKTGLYRRVYGDTGKRFRLASKDFQFTPKTKIQLHQISAADIQYYKGLYLARNIDFTMAKYGFACLADGAVIGFIEMNQAGGTTYIVDGKPVNGAKFWYMLSDFPIEPKPHPRLSKLIVMLAITVEMRRMLDYSNFKRSTGVITTARTEKPVSMKYRGPMKLIKRGEIDGEKFLNYMAVWPETTVQEAYRKWLKGNQ